MDTQLERLRIGFVCPYSFDEPGGVQAHILDLAQFYQHQGHEVAVIGPCSPDTEVPPFVVKGGRSLPFRYNGSVARLSFHRGVFRRVREFIRAGNFDVLHIHEPNSPSFSLAALMVAQGPIVATYHASARSSILLRLALIVTRKYLEKIRGGIAVSELARRWQVQQLGTDPVLIPNGVATNAYRRAYELHCKEHKISQEKVQICFIGRLDEPRKGLSILLEAFQGLADTAELVVIGAGKHHEQPGVRYVGKVSDAEKARILAASDIYVAPNTGGESFGIILVEAMAAGTAVIASDLEAFQAVLGNDETVANGVLFENGNSNDLRRVLVDLIGDPKRRQALQQNGLARAAVFDWEKVATDIMRVYRIVIDGSKIQAEP
ncbi:glycosyltransferase family 4 protein [Corynebacterium sp. HS2168-gen11]|uniref:glycosyltransferase family 4 protein n=1 Tax=Corynebacterium sp. HS2168-gen11 TaxID=2974027 RepID=UPI00216B01CE|nr:glycosyltransferase family 4 protein [Corynebacterium sp. HS2168-gen11]MCS4535204.1 glycosyltransferase family 4 protein [Corynebacterium sp. HS2168-gen11]